MGREIPEENIVPIGGREPDGSPSYIGPWTFKCGTVRRIVEEWMFGDVLNACAGKTHLSKRAADTIVRNDLNPDIDAHHHVDVVEIDSIFSPRSFDTVVFDPPYDQTQADEHYEGMHDRERGPARRKLAQLVEPGGVFLELGWNLHAPSDQSDKWVAEETFLFRRGPSHQPVFLTVDRKVQTRLDAT